MENKTVFLLLSFITALALCIIFQNQDSSSKNFLQQNQDQDPNGQILAVYSNRILQWWPPQALAQGIGDPEFTKNNYNVVLLTFWLSTGPADTALIFADPLTFFSVENPWGQTTKKGLQQAIIDNFHSKGIKLLVSAFGATEFPTTEGKHPQTTCDKLADFALENKFDGIDLDWEDNLAMEAGTGEQWLITCTKAIRTKMPKGKYILTHAPQAPYFIGTKYYKNGGYLTVDKEVGDLIDWYNIQFYNQGDSRYSSYETLFIKSDGFFSDTAVEQMIKNGIPKSRIVVGKPVTTGDATNTGWVSPTELGDWAKRAKSSIGWETGIFTWQLSSDMSMNYVDTYIRLSGAQQKEDN